MKSPAIYIYINLFSGFFPYLVSTSQAHFLKWFWWLHPGWMDLHHLSPLFTMFVVCHHHKWCCHWCSWTIIWTHISDFFSWQALQRLSVWEWKCHLLRTNSWHLLSLLSPLCSALGRSPKLFGKYWKPCTVWSLPRYLDSSSTASAYCSWSIYLLWAFSHFPTSVHWPADSKRSNITFTILPFSYTTWTIIQWIYIFKILTLKTKADF